ncbi:hypothetical protein TcCL_NonESM02349 [Trypanosoma cruzi]|nr:hypothetical protein TcCL_NonESM02349 [Trypanosoma cruzi]
MVWPPYDAARRCGGTSLLTLALVFSTYSIPRLSCSHDPADVPPYAPKVRQERTRKLPEKELVRLGAVSPAPAMLATDASMHGWSGLLLWGRGNCWRLAGTGAKRNSPADETPMGSPLVEFRCPTCGF